VWSGETIFGSVLRSNEGGEWEMIPSPTNEQLALFAKRVRRAISNERTRHHFGVSSEEYVFTLFPDVVRTLEWIEAGGEAENWSPQGQPQRPTLRKKVGGQ
jgi:hypothetical protein